MQQIITHLLGLCVQGINAREEHRETNDLNRAICTYNCLQISHCVKGEPILIHPDDIEHFRWGYLQRPFVQWFSNCKGSVLWYEILHNKYAMQADALLTLDTNSEPQTVLLTTEAYEGLKKQLLKRGNIF